MKEFKTLENENVELKIGCHNAIHEYNEIMINIVLRQLKYNIMPNKLYSGAELRNEINKRIESGCVVGLFSPVECIDMNVYRSILTDPTGKWTHDLHKKIKYTYERSGYDLITKGLHILKDDIRKQLLKLRLLNWRMSFVNCD